MLIDRKLKIIQRFEKKLLRFELEFQRLDHLHDEGNNEQNEDIFDLQNRNDNGGLLDNFDDTD